VFIGAYSLPILFKQQEIPTADVTIKATGNQWYWTHEYVDHDFGFDSYLIGSDATIDTSVRSEDENVTAFVLDEHMEAKLADSGYSRDEWLLATDTSVVVPVNKTIVVQVTGADVIHAWTIPAFGVKQDAVPGRLAQLWFKAEQEGIYFGQCSELCGKDHAYMPITVKVVSQEAYEVWLKGAVEEYAGTPLPVTVASK
jgi:cytochrome c oxidase subunit 2